MDDKKIIFSLDIGTRSVVGIVGELKDDNFNILDCEQEFHEKRAMRDGQIEDIDLVAKVANNVKRKLEQRMGQTFTKVSIAAAGRALKTASASFSYDLIPNEPITDKLIQYMEYSAIEKAQETFSSKLSDTDPDAPEYYCVGYSVTDYLLDDYKIKNLEGQKGKRAITNIIAAFLPSSVLISLYAVTARCNLEVDNLTLEPIAAIHSVVPDDVRFLNIALVDIGGGTSDIAISKDGSIIAYDMVTIAGDEITEAIMQHYLTNFATAEKIKLALNSEDNIEFKDILGNEVSLNSNEIFETIKKSINTLAEAISERILHINGSTPPSAVFLVGGGSQIRGLTNLVSEKLGIPTNRVAIGVVNTDNNLSLFSDSLYSPTFVTPIGIGIVSSLYRGCDFFSITVNGKRIMLFNHQNIKVIDALMFSGIKPSSLIGLSAPNLVYTLNGVQKIVKGTPGVPGELYVNGSPATIETEIKQSDEVTITFAKNGIKPSVTLAESLSEVDLNMLEFLSINDKPFDFKDLKTLKSYEINYMDEIAFSLDSKPKGENLEAKIKIDNSPSKIEEKEISKPTLQFSESSQNQDEKIDELPSSSLEHSSVSLLFVEEKDPSQENLQQDSLKTMNTSITVTLNNNPVHLVQETEEPLILMHLLKYVDLDVTNPRGELVLRINGHEANYADPLSDHDVAIIKWSEDM